MLNLTVKIIGLFLFFLVFTSFWAFFFSIKPSKIHSSITPDQIGLSFEKITFTNADNIKLNGWFLPNNKSSKVVILLHGYPADKGDILSPMSFLAEDYNLLLFDFRGLGESEGRISYLGARESQDLKAALNFLSSKGFEEVGIWGFSFGGAVALMGVDFPQVKAVVADSSYARLSLLASQLFNIPLLDKPLGFLAIVWGKIFVGIDAFKVSPADAVRKTQKPVLIIHSRDDGVIPFSHAEIIKEALAKNEKAQFYFKDGYHGVMGEEYRLKILDFFAKSL